MTTMVRLLGLLWQLPGLLPSGPVHCKRLPNQLQPPAVVSAVHLKLLFTECAISRTDRRHEKELTFSMHWTCSITALHV